MHHSLECSSDSRSLPLQAHQQSAAAGFLPVPQKKIQKRKKLRATDSTIFLLNVVWTTQTTSYIHLLLMTLSLNVFIGSDQSDPTYCFYRLSTVNHLQIFRKGLEPEHKNQADIKSSPFNTCTHVCEDEAVQAKQPAGHQLNRWSTWHNKGHSLRSRWAQTSWIKPELQKIKDKRSFRSDPFHSGNNYLWSH